MFVLLGSRGSNFAEAVATALRAAGVERERVQTLDLDGPLDGEALTIGPDFVRWRDLDLTRAEALLLERPLFSWPQPIDGAGRREVRALRLSAVLALAERAPVLNPPSAVEFVITPPLALDALAACGIAVRPWRYGPRDDGARAWRDAIGRVVDYEPRAPAVGEVGWSPEPFDGTLTTVLVIGGAIVASAEHANLAAWISASSANSARAPDGLADAAVALARRVSTELGLAFAAVTLAGPTEAPSVVDVDAAPDLRAWDRAVDGEVARAVARSLTQAAARAVGSKKR